MIHADLYVRMQSLISLLSITNPDFSDEVYLLRLEAQSIMRELRKRHTTTPSLPFVPLKKGA